MEISRTIIKDSKKSKIIKVDCNTKHLPISNLCEGKTYQTHNRDIVKILKIDNNKNLIILKNISQNCKQYTEFRHINFVKEF